MKEKKKTAKDLLGLVDIIPLKDFQITQNKYDIEIKTGVSGAIPQKFLQNMVAEGVIKSF